VTYRFVFISKRKFFGAKQISVDGSQVNISEPEKTIVDCLTECVTREAYPKWRRRFWYGVMN